LSEVSDKKKVIANLLSIEVQLNRGVSFSFLSKLDYSSIFLLHTFCMLGFLFFLFLQARSSRKLPHLNILLGGVLSNYLDRLCYGCVVDMFKLCLFGFDLFTCNLADIFITLGLLSFVFYAQKKPKNKFDKYQIKSENGL